MTDEPRHYIRELIDYMASKPEAGLEFTVTADERAEIEALAERVCPHTYRGLPCEREAHPDTERHWSAGANWPTELSDQNMQRAAS